MTAEIDRMKVIGTPPTKTPELYEKYLPYALPLVWKSKGADNFLLFLSTSIPRDIYTWRIGIEGILLVWTLLPHNFHLLLIALFLRQHPLQEDPLDQEVAVLPAAGKAMAFLKKVCANMDVSIPAPKVLK